MFQSFSINLLLRYNEILVSPTPPSYERDPKFFAVHFFRTVLSANLMME
jgi:hypothetical protein